MRTSSPKRSVLISGASIAGPALAHQLHARGFRVAVVERANAVRGGGYPIDVRGTAVEVVERMGLLPRLRAAHVDTRHITFLDADGSPIASTTPEAVSGGVRGRDVELPRGELTAALHDAVRDDVEFLFGDSIAALHDGGEHVDVTFRSGLERTFDLVIGADGLHSGTRELVFGPEEPFHRYLGRCFAGFTMPNHLGLSHGGLVLNTPGRAAVLYAPGDSDVLHAFLTFARSEPPFDAFADPGAQRDLVASVFADVGWEVPRMVEAMRAAPDLFFDVVSQIHLPRWSNGRVALVGDAAHATSFLSGQGSSVALVGAYVLAGELGRTTDHEAAFAAYEARVRPFAERNQALADAGGAGIAPRTAEELALRDEALRTASTTSSSTASTTSSTAASGDEKRDVHSSLDLPDHAFSS